MRSKNDVYGTWNFQARVNFAAQAISRSYETTRLFDTCFEMDDGDFVVVALYRRSVNNPKLANNLWRYLRQESVMEKVEEHARLSRQELKQAAFDKIERNLRQSAERWPDSNCDYLARLQTRPSK